MKQFLKVSFINQRLTNSKIAIGKTFFTFFKQIRIIQNLDPTKVHDDDDDDVSICIVKVCVFSLYNPLEMFFGH